MGRGCSTVLPESLGQHGEKDLGVVVMLGHKLNANPPGQMMTTCRFRISSWGIQLVSSLTEAGLTALPNMQFREDQLIALPASFAAVVAATAAAAVVASPESFGQLTALERLNLEQNLLTAFPENLEQNQLTVLPESIDQLTDLQVNL